MEQADRILQGAEDLFLHSGIKSITMDDIARHLGMSKKTIYQFYKDKNELVIKLVRKKLEEDINEINKIMKSEGNVVQQMLDMMKCSGEILSQVNPVAIHDLQKYHPEGWELFKGFKGQFLVEKLEELLTKGKEQGYIRPEVDVRIIARMRVAQVEMGFDTRLFPTSEFNSWKVQYQFLEHFNFGVCTLEGYKLLEQYCKNIIPQY
ncbi:TetR/AcrR family transcriptional regulator [Mucilaginibacter sp. JRF]|uniref:TetR/AcrR family transcriptional regulator n=1 Tax=Mucilaginibacter sp. JRF TaxID=2780088 RepID=UPI00187F0997|nr:TetR/AcrR family transcriptional regulator [Mucilaginibacter sp. JRF]MBE9583602.1 TetR/AcrR family transcriptional regulator [Mucilaginibacter sp. JRF]